MASDLLLDTAHAPSSALPVPSPSSLPPPGRPSARSAAQRSAPSLFHLTPVLPMSPVARVPRPAPGSAAAPVAFQPSLFPQPRVVVFDIETQRSFAQVGGHDAKALRELMVSVAVCYDSASLGYRTFWEPEVDQLIALLRQADLVVGFNILGFDYPVLARYTRARLSELPTLDLMADVARVLGHRLPLDALVSATLGSHKSASGLAAIEWWKEQALDKLEHYCRDDVRLTHALYDFGRRHGHVLYTPRDGGAPRKVRVHWR